MKKILSVLLALMLCLAPAALAQAPVRVCVLFSGALGDMSYNDAIQAGALRASAAFGCEITALEGELAADLEANFLAACDAGYDLILCASPGFAEYVKECAPLYPDVQFGILDADVSGDNVIVAQFASAQGAFLAGAAAALLTTRTDLPGINDQKIIGFVGGMDIPSERALYAGYEQGAQYITPGIRVFESYAQSWSDAEMGAELAVSQYELGADVVMNAAGGAGLGMLDAAVKYGRYAIGCNRNQDGDAPGNVATSLIRRLDEASYRIIESAVQGTTQPVLSFDLSNDGVYLTDMAVLKEALGEAFPQDIPETLAILRDQILSGEIMVVVEADPE